MSEFAAAIQQRDKARARVRELEAALRDMVWAAEKQMILPYNAPILVDARAALAPKTDSNKAG